MNRTTKFTQTKFKDHRAPPTPAVCKKTRSKKPLPTVADDASTSLEEETSFKSFTPPVLPAELRSFLIDITQEVVTAQPEDMIEHLGEYTLNLQNRLRKKQASMSSEEEDLFTAMMEEDVEQKAKEDHASRVIQTAYRGFKAKEKTRITVNEVKAVLREGATLADANRAASIIQRNYRHHSAIITARKNNKGSSDTLVAEEEQPKQELEEEVTRDDEEEKEFSPFTDKFTVETCIMGAQLYQIKEPSEHTLEHTSEHDSEHASEHASEHTSEPDENAEDAEDMKSFTAGSQDNFYTEAPDEKRSNEDQELAGEVMSGDQVLPAEDGDGHQPAVDDTPSNEAGDVTDDALEAAGSSQQLEKTSSGNEDDADNDN